MKIGILTFHSQLNYGGVLQCWALQQALTRLLSEERGVRSEECGQRNEVVVVDRWLSPDNWLLERGYNHWGARQWLKFALRVLMGCGDFAPWLRHWRTKRFIHQQLNLTPYHFHNWSELHSSTFNLQPSTFNIDCLVVGSDQVWHGGDWGDPRPYLLEGAPNIRAIAYAASFGITSLPAGIDYKAGLGRFSAISCREAEGVGLVRGLGFSAAHVVDPTALLDASAWRQLLKARSGQSGRDKKLVCYFLSQDVADAVSLIAPWAHENGWRVKILCDGSDMSPLPRSPMAMFRRMKAVLSRVFVRSRVKVCYGYGPHEFVRAFADADACIADSFHAVMFSSIFNLNLRFLRPQSDMRKIMFARVEEFFQTSVEGKVLAENVSVALESLRKDPRVAYHQDAIAKRREASLAWLRQSLAIE